MSDQIMLGRYRAGGTGRVVKIGSERASDSVDDRVLISLVRGLGRERERDCVSKIERESARKRETER